MKNKFGRRHPLPGRGSPGPPPGARSGGGRACAHGARSGIARTHDVGPPYDGLTTRGRGHGGRVQCELGSSRRRRPWLSDPRLLKLALGTWNVTSMLGKEPELVCEAERFRLDIVGLTLTHGLGSGTSPLLKGVGLSSTLELPVVRGAEQVWAYLLPPAVCVYIGVYPSGREGSLPPP